MTADPWTYSQPVAAESGGTGSTPLLEQLVELVPPAIQSPGDVDRVRARWRLDRQRNRRRISQALDDICVRVYGAEAAARYGIRDRRGWGG